MTMDFRTSAPRVIGELLIIIVGVVMALQFEEIRDERDERIAERQALVALRADLAETLSRLSGDMRRQQETLDAQLRLLTIAEGAEPPPQADSLGLLVGLSIRFQRLEPVSGSYDALVGAGDLRLIRNDSLRASLAALFGALGEGYEDEELSTALRAQTLMAASGTAPLAQVTGAAWRAMVGLPAHDELATYRDLLDEPRFMSGIMGLSLAETNQMRYFEAIRRQLESVLETVDVQLAR